MHMTLLDVALIIAAFLCTLVAGFLFAFAVVVMPGIRKLEDGAFIRAFQVMDGVIQANQPLFMLAWVGSVVAVIAAAALGFSQLDPAGSWPLVLAALAYLLGVQAPTIIVNIPLNNRLQALDVEAMDMPARAAARQAFEGRWNRSNQARTVISCLVSLLLLVIILCH
jgi:uncharacterized membrane protein